jgi:hypothetical protein
MKHVKFEVQGRTKDRLANLQVGQLANDHSMPLAGIPTLLVRCIATSTTFNAKNCKQQRRFVCEVDRRRTGCLHHGQHGGYATFAVNAFQSCWHDMMHKTPFCVGWAQNTLGQQNSGYSLMADWPCKNVLQIHQAPPDLEYPQAHWAHRLLTRWQTSNQT